MLFKFEKEWPINAGYYFFPIIYLIYVIGSYFVKVTLNLNNEKFDWIYINIGGEETELFMDFIKEHLVSDGKILVSGLVEWSFDKVKSIVESHGFKLEEKFQSNEWVTAIFR